MTDPGGVDDQFVLELVALLSSAGADAAALEPAAAWVWRHVHAELLELRLYVLDSHNAMFREEVVIDRGDSSAGDDQLSPEQLPEGLYTSVHRDDLYELQTVLSTDGTRVGLLLLRAASPFSQDVVNRLQHVARGLALGLASVRRARATERSGYLLRAATLVVRALHGGTTAEVAERLGRAMVTHLGFDRVTVCLFADESGTPPLSLCARTGGQVNRLKQAPPIPADLERVVAETPPSLWVPLQIGDRRLGALLVDNLYSLQPLAPDLLRLVADLCTVVALALDKTRLEALRAAENVRADEALRKSEARYRTVAELTSDFAFAFNVEADGTAAVEWMTDALARITGFEPSELLGSAGWMELIVAEDRASALNWWHRVLAGTSESHELRIRTRDGSIRSLLTRARPVRAVAPGGPVTQVYGIAQDVTEKRRWEQALQHQAFHDPLTDVGNRALFDARLRAALATSEPTRIALLVLDLDRFKEVNDLLGHQAGDALLKHVASRLLNCATHAELVARLGGDEFAVLVRVAHVSEAAALADAIHLALIAPVSLDGRLVEVGASVGIAVAPRHGIEAELLQRHADEAMYAAKHHGGGCRFYAPSPATAGRPSGLRAA